MFGTGCIEEYGNKSQNVVQFADRRTSIHIQTNNEVPVWDSDGRDVGIATAPVWGRRPVRFFFFQN
jgi:hypothetical protein